MDGQGLLGSREPGGSGTKVADDSGGARGQELSLWSAYLTFQGPDAHWQVGPQGWLHGIYFYVLFLAPFSFPENVFRVNKGYYDSRHLGKKHLLEDKCLWIAVPVG